MSISCDARFSTRIVPLVAGAVSGAVSGVLVVDPPAQADVASTSVTAKAEREARMTSPWVNGAERKPAKVRFGRAAALAVIAATIAAPCFAQDSATAVTAARPDSSVGATPATPATANDTTRRAPTPPPPPPVDSAIGRACRQSGGAAPDLVLVTFRATATEEERAAVAEEIGGKLVAPSVHARPGAWYLRVPGSGSDPTIADRLIMMSPVQEVGETRCPS
jgi:hypothetical protein